MGTKSQARKMSLEQRSPGHSESTSGGIRSVDKHPLDMFPEEVWGLVLRKLGPIDLASSFEIGSTFRSWLLPKRTEFLAHKVFPFLDLTTAEKLRCRQVCRSWKVAVDLDCETKPLLCEGYLRYNFEEILEVGIFKSSMLKRPTPGGNPFVSRNVRFTDRNCEDEDETDTFWNGVAELLELYGKHIWYIRLEYDQFNFRSAYQNLEGLIQLLPSLRGLSMYQYGIDSPGEKAVIRITPLPQLLRLEYSNNWATREPPKIGLLRACNPSTLEQLKILVDTDFVDEGGCELLATFLNLKRLDLYDRLWIGLPHLQEVPWRLEQLSLHIKLDETYSYWNEKNGSNIFTLSNLFRWLHKFRDTLRSLTLYFVEGPADIGGNNMNLRLALPHLQHLAIKMRHEVGISSLDIVQDLVNLEELSLEMCNKEFHRQPNHKETIQFGGYESRMYESNLWKVLPKLNFLELKDCIYHYVYRKPSLQPSSTKKTGFVLQMGSSTFEKFYG